MDKPKPGAPSKPAVPSPKIIKANISRLTAIRTDGKGKDDHKRKTQELLMMDLKSNKLLTDDYDQALVLELNTREMRLNGKKMAGNIHKSFKNKYLKGDSDRIFFVNDSENK